VYHYCYSFDNRVKGMTEEVARASIDWLHSTTCRVLALMGGEVVLRPPFVHKVVYCEPNCFSTLNHIVAWCYNDARVIKWLMNQARHGFQRVRGNM
jgi:hypothetical protein